jgi:hypothetical protein
VGPLNDIDIDIDRAQSLLHLGDMLDIHQNTPPVCHSGPEVLGQARRSLMRLDDIKEVFWAGAYGAAMVSVAVVEEVLERLGGDSK